MRLGIVGSRRWSDFLSFGAQMPSLDEYDTIVSGGQLGVDKMAERLAAVLGKEFICYPKLRKDGDARAQAHARNQRIVDASDALIAFPGPHSTGTWDTVRRAREKGIPIIMRKAEN